MKKIELKKDNNNNNDDDDNNNEGKEIKKEKREKKKKRNVVDLGCRQQKSTLHLVYLILGRFGCIRSGAVLPILIWLDRVALYKLLDMGSARL